MTAKDAGDVILRLAPTADDAIPNAHPVYLSALVRLAGLTGDARWLARADALFEAVGAIGAQQSCRPCGDFERARFPLAGQGDRHGGAAAARRSMRRRSACLLPPAS